MSRTLKEAQVISFMVVIWSFSSMMSDWYQMIFEAKVAARGGKKWCQNVSVIDLWPDKDLWRGAYPRFTDLLNISVQESVV